MTATAQDFEMRKGDTKILEFTVKDSDGAVVDITGATAKWEAAQAVTASTKDIAKSGISPSDATNGKFQVTISPSDTSSLNPGRFYHEAELTDASSRVITVAVGQMTLLEDLV